MRTTLRINNVGGLVGEHSFGFESGRVNLIESSNSAGKSSIVRGIAGILSMTATGLEPFIQQEAEKLGVKTDERNPQEGFVNVHAEKASVILDYDSKKDTYVVKRDGAILGYSETADPRFLLTGVLSNDSKILRQLRGLDDEEPDNFRWAVARLSNAEGYEQVANALKNIKENLQDRKLEIEKGIHEIAQLIKRREKLEEERTKLEKELNSLKPKFAASGMLLEQRRKLNEEIEAYNERKARKLEEIEKVKHERLDKSQKLLEEAQDRKEDVLKELESIDIDKFSHEATKEFKSIDDRLEELKDKRGEVDGLLNLFVTAEGAHRQHPESTKCPLCENGRISYQKIKQKLSELRRDRENYNAQIVELNQKKQGMDTKLSKMKERLKERNQELRDLKTDILNYERSMDEPKRSIRSMQQTVDGYDESIADKKKKLKEVVEKIGKSDEEVNKEYTKKENLMQEVSSETGGIKVRLAQLSSTELLGMILEPNKAKDTCEFLLEKINGAIKYAMERAEEELQRASSDFNENIKVLMKTLKFKEFRNIQLTKESRLYVERLNPKGDYVSQQVRTLSTSEKLAIAVILQAAIKETYMRGVPFFILDDVIEDFDDERKKLVLEYLKEKAKQENWFVLVTKLVDGFGGPKVRYL